MNYHPHKYCLDLTCFERIAAVDQPYLQSSDTIMELSHYSIIHRDIKRQLLNLLR